MNKNHRYKNKSIAIKSNLENSILAQSRELVNGNIVLTIHPEHNSESCSW